jgi:alpha-glucosidase
VFREASATGLPVARPIFFADLKDPALRAEDRGFLLGDSLLVSARVTPRGDEAPALPRGWVRFHFPGEAPDPNLPELYIRPGAAIPAGPVMQFVNEKPLDQLDLFVALDAAGRATGTLYEDAGDGFGFEQGEYRVTRYTVIRSNGRITCTSTSEGRWPTPAKRTVRLIVVGGSE